MTLALLPGGGGSAGSGNVGNGGSSGSGTGGTSTGGSGGSSAQGGTGLTGGCFAPGEKPASVEPAGFSIPDVEAEKKAYQSFGFTWAPEAEPSAPAEASYSVSDPDIHGDTESDDLWTHLMMSERSGKPGYEDRAK